MLSAANTTTAPGRGSIIRHVSLNRFSLIGGSYYGKIVRDDYTHAMWLYSSKKEMYKEFNQFLVDAYDHGKVEAAHSDNEGEITGERVMDVCSCHHV